MFADDIILIAEASSQQAQNMLHILDFFCDCSSQRINFSKSKVYYSRNVSQLFASELSQVRGIDATSDLSHYLGMPIITGRKGKVEYSIINDRVRSKLTGWKATSLSMAGHITLAQSCIQSLPNYAMQSSCIPSSICDEVERLCRNFIRGSTTEGRKCHVMFWEHICKPKSDGRLGFKSLCVVNK